MGKPKGSVICDKAMKVLNDSNISSYPIDIIKIAKDHGFKVYLQYLPQNISGMINIDDKNFEGFDTNKVIIVNKYDVPLRRRFTIAHELAHYFLHKVEEDKLYAHRDDGAMSDEEREANLFASFLLMPENMIKNVVDIEQQYSKVSDAVLAGIISDQFQVSLPAAEVRLKQLKLIS